MCFDADSSPPVHVIAGAAVSHESLTLNAADGNTFRGAPCPCTSSGNPRSSSVSFSLFAASMSIL